MSSNGILTEDELIKDELIADEIQDDTNLLQRFQTVDRTDPRAISAFANDVDCQTSRGIDEKRQKVVVLADI